MTNSVDVNLASEQQLMALLHLSQDEARAVQRARPFSDESALRRVLPPRFGEEQQALGVLNEAPLEQLTADYGLPPSTARLIVERRPLHFLSETRDVLGLTDNHLARMGYVPVSLALPKLDINQASEEALTEYAGLSLTTARAILARRPYYFLSELRAVPEVDSTWVEPFFTISPMSYVDKQTLRPVSLSPEPSRLVLFDMANDTESDQPAPEGTLRRLGLRRVRPAGRSADSKRASVHLYVSSDTESAQDVWGSLKRELHGRITPGFREQDGTSRYLAPGHCVIQFSDSCPPEKQTVLLAQFGLTVKEHHRTQGLYTVLVPQVESGPAVLARTLVALNASPEVKFAEPNYIGVDDFESQEDLDGGTAESWNLAMVHAAEAWSRQRGAEDVLVAVIDSGVDVSHPALKGTIVPYDKPEEWNFTDDSDAGINDEDGHGTFIAGLLVGNGNNGLQGLCPGCRLLPLKIPCVADPSGYARRRDAILYAVRFAGNRRLVINISWKTTGDVTLIRDAVEGAAAEGTVVVASAGNWPTRISEPHYPSDYPSVISVAALGPNAHRALYSYYGDEIDISAPGGAEGSDPAKGIRSASPGGGETISAGTSFAAPHVVAVAALMLSQDRSLTPAQIRFRMQSTAVPLSEPGMGSGLVNAGSALGAAAAEQPAPPTPPTPPQPSEVDSLQTVNTVDLYTLVGEYGLLQITARLILARRPFSRPEQLRGTLGLTQEQYQRLTVRRSRESGPIGPSAPTPPAPPTPPQPSEVDSLQTVNTVDLYTLVGEYGLLQITARLILARRPFSRPEQLRGTLGLTQEQYQRLTIRRDLESGLDERSASTPPPPPAPPTSPQQTYSKLDIVSSVLSWRSGDRFQRDLIQRYISLLANRLEQAKLAFTHANVGWTLNALLRDLPDGSYFRILSAPETANRLLHGGATDLVFWLNSASAEHHLLAKDPVSVTEPVWTALGDFYFSYGETRKNYTASTLPFDPAEPYLAPRLDIGIPVDLVSPFATRKMPNLVDCYHPYEPDTAGALISLIQTALKSIAKVSPQAYDHIRAFTRTLILRQNPASSSYISESTNHYIGRILLVNAQLPTIRPAMLADSLVHEAIHAFLYQIEEEQPFVADFSAIRGVKVTSPWSNRQLDVHSFLHACLVWFGMWQFWRQAQGGAAFDREDAQRMLTTSRAGFDSPKLQDTVQGIRRYMSTAAQDLLLPLLDEVRRGIHG